MKTGLAVALFLVASAADVQPTWTLWHISASGRGEQPTQQQSIPIRRGLDKVTCDRLRQARIDDTIGQRQAEAHTETGLTFYDHFECVAGDATPPPIFGARKDVGSSTSPPRAVAPGLSSGTRKTREADCVTTTDADGAEVTTCEAGQ